MHVYSLREATKILYIILVFAFIVIIATNPDSIWEYYVRLDLILICALSIITNIILSDFLSIVAYIIVLTVNVEYFLQNFYFRF